MDSMEIADWRNKIDGLDEQIVQLLSQRAAAAVEIGKLKAKINVPIYEPKREQTVYEHVRECESGTADGCAGAGHLRTGDGRDACVAASAAVDG